MAWRVQIQESSLALDTPENLLVGELAVNTTDSKLFVGAESGMIELLRHGTYEPINDNIQTHIGLTDHNPHGTNWSQLDGVITSLPFAVDPIPEPVSEGSIWWSSLDATVKIGLTGGNVDAPLSQTVYVPRRCTNNTGSDMIVGSVVYINNVDADHFTIDLADASAESELTSTKTMGILAEGIANNGRGYVAKFGIVKGINTASYAPTTKLWLSTIAGEFTNIKPVAPAHAVFIGYVVVQDSFAGEVFVDVINGFEIGEMHDVDTNGSSIGDILVKQVDGVWRYSGVYTDTKDPTGWLNPSAITVEYDSVARKIRLTGALDYYWRGIKKSLTSPWTSDAHGLTTGLAYFLSTSDGTTFTWANSVWTFDVIMVAFISYGATHKFGIRECHGLMPWQSHEQNHDNVGTYRKSGGTIGAIVTGSNTAANRRPTITATTLHDEDLPTIISALTAGSYTHVTLTGTGVTSFAVNQIDIVPVRTNNPDYNAFQTPNWMQTPMANVSYMTVWCVALPVTSDVGSQAYRFLWIQGQTNGTLTAQQALNPQDLNLGQLAILAPEFNFIGKVILNYQGNNWTVHSVIALTGNRAITVGSPAGLYISSIATDATLTGDGTVGNPLSAVGDNVTYTIRYDDVGGNIAYLGEAVPGSLTSAAVWRIRYLDLNSADLTVMWADGNSNLDNVWDNRLSLSYS